MKRLLPVLATCFICITAVRANELRVAIRSLIDATQKVVKAAQEACKTGDQKACDQQLVAQARISLLRLELRHRSGKIQDALMDVDSAMSDLELAVDDE